MESPPEVAELSRISVFGIGGGAEDRADPVAGWAMPDPAFIAGGFVPLLGSGGTEADGAFPAEGAAEGCVAAVLLPELPGCGFAMGVCGVPEPSLG